MSKAKVVMIGAGHLGALLLKQWIKNKTVKSKEFALHLNTKASLLKLKKSYPKFTLSCAEDNSQIPTGDIYIIAVKPQQWASLKEPLKNKIKKNSLVISIMAGIPPSRLQEELGCAAIVCMTNTSLQVGTALTTLYKSSLCKKDHVLWATKAFAPFGMIVELEEKDFAAATALGGSHPAFAIWILNELSKIIEKKLPGQNGMEWALNIFKGAEKLIRKKKDVNAILTQIATPGGCTAEGLRGLEELGISGKLGEVFDRCQRKAETLGK